jgi:glucuronosyltransferase
MQITQFLLLVVLGSRLSESYRILGLFPHPAISHFRAFQPLLVELAALGHEVFVVSHFPFKNAPENYRDLVLDQSDIMTGSFSVDEVSGKRNTIT